MVPADQHLGHLPAAKLRRTRVLRPIEEAGLLSIIHCAEGFVQRRILVAEDARQQPRDRVHHHRGSQFAATQHIIADGDLFVGQALGHPLVHALVAAAEQQQAAERSEAPRGRLIEQPSLRGE